MWVSATAEVDGTDPQPELQPLLLSRCSLFPVKGQAGVMSLISADGHRMVLDAWLCVLGAAHSASGMAFSEDVPSLSTLQCTLPHHPLVAALLAASMPFNYFIYFNLI